MAGLLESIVVNDPVAMREATRVGIGIELITMLDVLFELERSDLMRLLLRLYADALLSLT
jgi:hypothetical protein